jgi:hypothetical protein
MSLLKAAAEQPEAVVCDLRDVTADETSLTVLLAVADQLACWPASPIVALASNPRLILLPDFVIFGRVGPRCGAATTR